MGLSTERHYKHNQKDILEGIDVKLHAVIFVAALLLVVIMLGAMSFTITKATMFLNGLRKGWRLLPRKRKKWRSAEIF